MAEFIAVNDSLESYKKIIKIKYKKSKIYGLSQDYF